MKNKPLSIDALFIGPKAENARFLANTMEDFIRDHFYWRKDYHPDDRPVITLEEQNTPGFFEVQQRTISALESLSAKLRSTSPPWQSPRYLGHMNSEILMPSILGYVTTMLYNPNNCAYEGAPATTPLELEVGMDFCRLLGFDTNRAWGHLTSDGTIANIEGLWYARNLASIPFAVKKIRPQLVEGMSDWELSNMKMSDILDLSDKVQDQWGEIRDASVRGTGVRDNCLGKWIVPQSKHYSWMKAVDLLGLGIDNLIDVQVDEFYRMDIGVLEQTINSLVDQQIPVLGVVGVISTTEEGAIDYLDQIVALRDKFEKERGVSFYIHADAAHGGYGRAIFLDEDSNFIPFDDLRRRLVDDGIFDETIDWPTPVVYNAFKALGDVDSVTIDPHKMGYVPYAAGGIAVRDARMTKAISFFAAYVFDDDTAHSQSLGSFILEGSKAGAEAAAVWMAHQVLPLNITGYGKLIGASILGAQKFYNKLKSTDDFMVDDRTIHVEILTKPDFNIIDWAYNIKGNTDLKRMNNLNRDLFNLSAPFGTSSVMKSDFFTSHTDLDYANYRNAPLNIVKRLGIPAEQWNESQSMVVLRACVMTPYFTNHDVLLSYWDDFMSSMNKKMLKIFNAEDLAARKRSERPQ